MLGSLLLVERDGKAVHFVLDLREELEQRAIHLDANNLCGETEQQFVGAVMCVFGQTGNSLMPATPFLLRMGYVFVCLVVIFITMSLCSKKTVKAEEITEAAIKSQLKWSKILFIAAAICLVLGIAGMCSEYFRSWGIEAIFFLTAMFAVLGIYLNSNAKDKVQDVKALSIDLTLFNTDKTFSIGSALVIIILIILYIALW